MIMRSVIVILVFAILISCVPAAYRGQTPSTILYPPIESDLKIFYDNNMEGILCLADKLSPQRMLIGVGGDFSSEGFKVKSIINGSPAKAAGLKIGDIITKVNGKPLLYSLKIDSPSDIDIKRESTLLTVRIVPTILQSNNAVETEISVEEQRDEKYIVETIDSGVVLNTIQFKSNYERSRWMVTNWSIVFWGFNTGCLQDKVISENIAIRIQYRHRNFVTEQYQKGHAESLEIYSKRADILSYTKGVISVQDLLDKSLVFINGSREKLLMQ